MIDKILRALEKQYGKPYSCTMNGYKWVTRIPCYIYYFEPIYDKGDNIFILPRFEIEFLHDMSEEQDVYDKLMEQFKYQLKSSVDALKSYKHRVEEISSLITTLEES